MVSVTIDASSAPIWAENYFLAYKEWFNTNAPKPLPKNSSSYIKLYGEYIGIEFEVISNLNSKRDEIESFTFTWNNDEDKTMFLLRY
jgi:hypothetical protein